MNGMKEGEKRPVLSICIPTWNRAKLLDESLDKLASQLLDIEKDDVELYISDNASIDDTPWVVQKHISQGMPINYNRNSENLGAARNFIHCIRWSKGQYVWLLGDDDFLKENALKRLIAILKGKEYGLLHFYTQGTKEEEPTIISDRKTFLCKISYWITFMSGNIFNRDIIKNVTHPEKYIPSHLLQVPYYLEAALCHNENVIIGTNHILLPPADSANNGGYNYFEVFVRYYLNIWKEKLMKYDMGERMYDYIRKDIYKKFIVGAIVRLLFLRENISLGEENKYGRKGWKIDGAWTILFRYYGNCFYFYYSPISYVFSLSVKKTCKLIKRLKKEFHEYHRAD